MVSGAAVNGTAPRSSRLQDTSTSPSPTPAPASSVQRRGKRKIPHRIIVACTTCRNQHLRCDGANPTCSRCREGNKHCVYEDIRRRSRRLQGGNHATLVSSSSPPAHGGLSRTSWSVSESPDVNVNVNTTPYSSYYDGLYSPNMSATLAEDPFAAPQHVNPRHSKALDSFYTSFFRGHPFVLPKPNLIDQFDKDPTSVANVIKAIALVGSLYILDPASQGYRTAVESSIASGLPRNGFSVQCLMLFAGVLEWSGEQESARVMLDKAKSIATDIGLQWRSFASEHGHGCPALEESWRRTWWELYIIDAIFAAILHSNTFDLWHVESDVDLPCEEMAYMKERIPPPRTLAEYDDRAFEDANGSFSSFTYLIDAARMLGTTLLTVDKEGVDIMLQVKNAEANITSWHLYLPESKKEPVLPDGSIDEIMFRAHMLLSSVTTHLHRPRSRLHYSTMEILCSKYAPPQSVNISEVFNERHTMQAIKAATSFVELFTIPSNPTTHSPFVMCMGSMAAATHISACEYYLRGSEYAHAKDRVRVFLGALRAFEGIWPQARKWSGEMKLMAKAVFSHRDKNGNLLTQVGEGGITDELGSGVTGLDLSLLRSCFEVL